MADAPAAESAQEDVIVDPWTVSGNINYDKLIEQFGSQPLTPALIEKFERVTGRTAHTWIRRGIFFSHRDLDAILDNHAAGKPMYLYTGRGPSSESLHLGHRQPDPQPHAVGPVFLRQHLPHLVDPTHRRSCGEGDQ